ncbi:hypothetical protein BGZ63DRAFT_377681, partial [Mariannaea sp. PMI_226]
MDEVPLSTFHHDRLHAQGPSSNPKPVLPPPFQKSFIEGTRSQRCEHSATKGTSFSTLARGDLLSLPPLGGGAALVSAGATSSNMTNKGSPSSSHEPSVNYWKKWLLMIDEWSGLHDAAAVYTQVVRIEWTEGSTRHGFIPLGPRCPKQRTGRLQRTVPGHSSLTGLRSRSST